jgi:hypothetical protein
MVDIARPSNTLGLREEVLRLEEELKIRQWQEQQLAIADGCDVCSSAYLHTRQSGAVRLRHNRGINLPADSVSYVINICDCLIVAPVQLWYAW